MKVLLLNTQVPFCRGGAEVLAEDLRDALIRAGHDSEILTIPFKWYPQETLVNSILACKLLEISDFNNVKMDKAIGLKFPTWLMNHPDKSYWILHQHRTAYDLWDTEYCDLIAMENGHQLRELIMRADSEELSKADNVNTISKTVSKRLLAFNNVSSSVLYPPPRGIENFYLDKYGDYLFFPSRINPIKRQELVIEALAHTSEPVRVVFAGTADNDNYLKKLQRKASSLGVQDRITWLGNISEQEKLDAYAAALMVIFTPKDEDYGYITPEAMLSSKAIITVNDSGGPLEFVTHKETGLIASPSAESLAEQFDTVWSNKALASEYGKNAKELIESKELSWNKVINRLLA